MSGSRREGFRLKGSDIDTMYWFNDHRVIMDMSQSEYYNTANTILIFADSSESPPGFTLLQKLTPSTRLIEETNQLLCSYHMKTTLFWAIQQNTLPHWCSRNLLAGFWICFKLLLKWVYKGICPNFFIPQNNMFLTKVHGSAQNRLFLQLHKLYKKGLACLLQSSSIRSYIIDVLYNPRLSICTDESIIRHIDTTLSLAALDELQVLVHHGRRPLVHKMQREISWEILGICQQMTGNLEAALYSYQQSQITQHPFFNIQTARQRRIQDIVQSTQHQYTEDLPLD
uniref:Mab-21-like HhH/H2TH-like domain-containing protein n=1 Tax=Magallana gigas TaxID=29159 RepID=K1RXI9_MAGGI